MRAYCSTFKLAGSDVSVSVLLFEAYWSNWLLCIASCTTNKASSMVWGSSVQASNSSETRAFLCFNAVWLEVTEVGLGGNPKSRGQYKR